MNLIHQRPEHARVFCIGIGNEINRPLLAQLAEDSGGLAAFISGNDDFTRQAKAFRRKLMRPAAQQLSLTFDGIQVYDQQPATLPNLYYGAPVRVYGRYRGKGEAKVILKGQIQGRALTQSISLMFPREDPNNPEIERMWAQKKINRLLKTADRRSNRQEVIDEVVRLGETFSIITEYTSFLVLENDAEYKRWKIERRNAERLQRDRAAQSRRRQSLESLRRKAMQDIGPHATGADTGPAPNSLQQPLPTVSRAPQATPQPGAASPQITRQQSRNLNFGSGPVGPLFLGLAMLIRRFKKRG